MREEPTNRRMIGTLAFILIGPIFWALQLTVSYGTQSSLCAFAVGSDPSGANALAPGAVLVVSALCIAGALLALLRPRASYILLAGPNLPEEQWSFLTWIMRALSALAILAMLYAALGAVLLPACAQLR